MGDVESRPGLFSPDIMRAREREREREKERERERLRYVKYSRDTNNFPYELYSSNGNAT
jgi:hypothetical protein